MAKKLVVGLGEVLWDVFGAEKHLGGAPTNFAYHAAALGDRGVPATRVGRDAPGREILESLTRLGLPTDWVQTDARRPTGRVIVKLDRAGKPDFTIVPNVAYENLQPTRKLLSLAARADAICYGTLGQRGRATRNTLRKALAAAPNALLVCDLNLRAEFLDLERGGDRVEIVARSIADADVLKLNDDEARIVRRAFGRPERDDAFLRWLLREFRLRLVCVTLGPKGALLRTPRQRVRARGVRVDIADTVGSGDAFAAALVNRLLRRRPLAEAAALANRLGAFVASRAGATPGLDGFVRRGG